MQGRRTFPLAPVDCIFSPSTGGSGSAGCERTTAVMDGCGPRSVTGRGGAVRGGAQLNPPESDEQVKRSSNATHTYTQFPLIKNFPDSQQKVSKQSNRNFPAENVLPQIRIQTDKFRGVHAHARESVSMLIRHGRNDAPREAKHLDGDGAMKTRRRAGPRVPWSVLGHGC